MFSHIRDAAMREHVKKDYLSKLKVIPDPYIESIINKSNKSDKSDNSKEFQTFDKTSKLPKNQCRYCTKEFRRGRNCRDHEKHCSSSELIWICDQCGKSYKTEKGLIWHKNTHQEMQTTYICRNSNCNHTYKSLSELRKHCYLLDHAFPEVEGPVWEDEQRCEVCYKVYKKYIIEIHMEEHQKKTSRVYECKHCKYKTKRENHLTRHMESKHNTHNIDFDLIKEHFEKLNKNYKCPRCKNIFENYETASDHLILKKCGDENICKICNIKFTMKQNLIAHRRRKHPEL